MNGNKHNTVLNKLIPLLAAFVLAFGSAQATLAETKTEENSEQISISAFRAPGEKESTVKTMRKQLDETAKTERQAPSEKRDNTKQKLQKHDGHVWIDSAAVGLSTDFDGDGYYTRIALDFDVDTDYLVTDVYARLFLSLEQGPWVEYAVTDNFSVTSVGGDAYYVDTDLVEGFPPGYYDLRIEVYDALDDYLLASYGPADSAEVTLLPLEDELADSAFVNEPAGVLTISDSGGGGSVGGLTLLALLLLTALQSIARNIVTVRRVALLHLAAALRKAPITLKKTPGKVTPPAIMPYLH